MREWGKRRHTYEFDEAIVYNRFCNRIGHTTIPQSGSVLQANLSDPIVLKRLGTGADTVFEHAGKRYNEQGHDSFHCKQWADDKPTAGSKEKVKYHPQITGGVPSGPLIWLPPPPPRPIVYQRR